MILQGSLRIEYNNESFFLMVKTFLRNGVYYFYISDKEKEKPLLGGKILELTYTDSFCLPEKEAAMNDQNIPSDIIEAIENMLMENRQLWYY